MTRRIVIRDCDELYGICGLIEDTQLAHTVVNDGDGHLFKLAAVTDRYVLYVPDVPTEPDLSTLPDSWLPFVEHGMPPWLAQP